MTSKTAMVITASSQPRVPPKRGSREVMRIRYAATASTPPMIPAHETTFDPSRMGAEHRTLVAFCEAGIAVSLNHKCLREQWRRLTKAFSDCTTFGDANFDLSSDSLVAAAASDVGQLARRGGNRTQKAVALDHMYVSVIHAFVVLSTYTTGWHTGQQLSCLCCRACGRCVGGRFIDVGLAGACLRCCHHGQCHDSKDNEAWLPSRPKLHHCISLSSKLG